MSRCGMCTNCVTLKKQAVSCSGICKKPYHLACIGATSELLALIKDTPGLTWKCSNCREIQELFDEHEIRSIFQKKLESLFDNLNGLFDAVKLDFLKRAEEKISQFELPNSPTKIINKPSYSSVICNSSHPAVIVKPKSAQENKQTKSDILRNFNPINSDINISKIKHIKDGGLLVSCQTTEETQKFKQIAQEKLSNQYDVRKLKGLHPRLRIVGLTDKLDQDTICNLVVKQNRELFSENSDCKIIKIWPTKNNKNVFQAILQLNIPAYNKVIDNGYLLVGLDICTVYAIEILRCFNCNGFNHSKGNCKNNLSCPKCSMKHNVDSCQAVKLKCSNCLVLSEKPRDSNINIEHAAWDYVKCQSYKNAVSKLKADLGHNK